LNLFIPNTSVFIASIAVDLIFGEWPNSIHPVVWMGRMANVFDISTNSKSIRFLFGVMLVAVDVSLWLVVTFLFCSVHPQAASWVLQVFLLKSTFSMRSLYRHVSKCACENTEKMRKNVSMIVSRDVTKLDKAHLVSAALESLSENTSDSITGPFLYYALFGIGGAVIYRVVNTLDAVVGYRTERFEWFGKVAARADDFLNFIPSRITAIVFTIFSPSKAWNSMKIYGGSKINASYPMSAFSGVLGVWFEKKGVYRFEGREPVLNDIFRGLKIYTLAVVLLIVIFSLIVAVR
jgi:adenosylcobinamide-phosphate synthase